MNKNSDSRKRPPMHLPELHWGGVVPNLLAKNFTVSRLNEKVGENITRTHLFE